MNAETTRLTQLAHEHLWMPFTQLSDLIADDGPRVICRAEGSYLYDTEGKAYLDGVSALEAMVAGHGRKALLDAANMSAMLLYIITNAILFSFLLTAENIPQHLAQWIIGQGLSPWMFLLFVNILLFFAGDFMEPSSIILILAPLFLPVAQTLGIDPIHLGIIMTINMELGMITPPVGLNLYVASGLAKMGLTEVTKAAAPWILVVTAVLLLVTYVPEIALWLPNLLYGAAK